MSGLKRFVPFTHETLAIADETFDQVDFDKSCKEQQRTDILGLYLLPIGVVSSDELFVAFSKSYKDFDRNDAKSLLKHYDGDGDGKLTYREFIKFFDYVSEP